MNTSNGRERVQTHFRVRLRFTCRCGDRGDVARSNGGSTGVGEITSPEQIHLLEVFATQIALALERSQISAEAREAEVRIETEQMRNSLLSAVSHDLRTPLASITGAASSLLSHQNQLNSTTQHELLESIAQEAQRLGRLVNNLLEMTRLESGAVEIRRDWHSIEEIVGAALNRLGSMLGARPVRIDIPAELPLVSVDDVLLEQVFINLLENAAKYTPDGSEIPVVCRRRREQGHYRSCGSWTGVHAG